MKPKPQWKTQKEEEANQPSSASGGYLASLVGICNSTLAHGIAISLIILSILLGMGGCIYLYE